MRGVGDGAVALARTKGSKGIKLKLSDHAVENFRTRWPACRHYDDKQIQDVIETAVSTALLSGLFVNTPGGVYFPISAMGTDGYAVVKNNVVKTVMPEEWCKDVNVLLMEKSHAA